VDDILGGGAERLQNMIKEGKAGPAGGDAARLFFHPPEIEGSMALA